MSVTREEIDALRFNVKHKDSGEMKDAFIGGMMELLFLRNEIGALFGKRRIKKQLPKIAAHLALDRCAEEDAEGKRLFTDAYRDAALLFIKLSAGDEVYSTGFLNLKKLSEADVTAKLEADFALMSVRLPEIAEMTETFAPFAEGLSEALERRRQKIAAVHAIEEDEL
ncbi:MAG: hypothetical protein Q4C53_06585 [Clostridia bacterium]|nr:hypothetical protein [Clostridia bacterium]